MTDIDDDGFDPTPDQARRIREQAVGYPTTVDPDDDLPW